MSRYILFGFEDYYPQGGMNDVIGTFDTLEEIDTLLDGARMTFAGIQVYDTKTAEYEKFSKPYRNTHKSKAEHDRNNQKQLRWDVKDWVSRRTGKAMGEYKYFSVVHREGFLYKSMVLAYSEEEAVEIAMENLTSYRGKEDLLLKNCGFALDSVEELSRSEYNQEKADDEK